MNTITKPATNMIVTMKKEYGNKVVCNKHFRIDYHRATGQFSNKDCDCCREIKERCTMEDIGL
jgi:hypothetical protein